MPKNGGCCKIEVGIGSGVEAVPHIGSGGGDGGDSLLSPNSQTDLKGFGFRLGWIGGLRRDKVRGGVAPQSSQRFVLDQ